MCGPTESEGQLRLRTAGRNGIMPSQRGSMATEKAPIGVVLQPPSLIARYACASLMLSVFLGWGKFAFLGAEVAPQVGSELHSAMFPLAMTVGYLVALPLLRLFSKHFLLESIDVKLLLKETMVVYNGCQVLLNMWMVFKFIQGLAVGGHPFIGSVHMITPGVTYAVWIHYFDKYLEFFDTFFMVIRGKMDQVSFLHLYHHVSIAWAWWFAMWAHPGGDNYFGALLNSLIHVMMYSYYTLSLLRISCPWKKYLTMAQLIQFCTVIAYTFPSAYINYNSGDMKSQHAWCVFIQIFEMSSLFFLFMIFYSKTYKKKSKAPKVTQEVGPQSEQVSVSSESSDEAKKEQ